MDKNYLLTLMTFKLTLRCALLALLAISITPAFAAQPEGVTADAPATEGQKNSSKPTTAPEFDRYWGDYWGDEPNPDMSAKAYQLIHPDKYYLEEDSYIVAECEAAYYNDKWELRTEPDNYFGDGYLQYVGPNLQGNFDGHNTDIYVQYQQNIEDRLIFPIRITNPGIYRARTHVINFERDGDNDAWINLMHTPRRATRFGGKVPGQLHWNKFGWDGKGNLFTGKFNSFKFEVPGDYLLYISGRSKGFGVDRVVLHKDDKAEVAMAPDTPVSKMVPADQD